MAVGSRSARPVLVVLLAAGCSSSAAQRPQEEADLLARIIAADDARGRTEHGINALIDGVASPVHELRRMAVRAYGRLEMETVPFTSLLAHDDAGTRAEAANAIGQAFLNSGDPGELRELLAVRARVETDDSVRGIMAATLGRMRHRNAAEVAATVALLVEERLTTRAGDDAFVLGVARGLHFLVRQPAGRDSLPESAIAALRTLIMHGREASGDNVALTARRIRTVAAAALVASRHATASDITEILGDPDPYVRREALAAVAALPASSRTPIMESALADTSPVVRYDALRVYGGLADRTGACPHTLRAVGDANPHVALLALSQLGTGCGGAEAIALLDARAAALPAALTDTSSGWHVAATALVALAAADAARARERLPAFVSSANPFVRMHAARAAAALQAVPALHTLIADVHPNVRTEAIPGLAAAVGHTADSLYVAQLREDDSQLVQAAAAALEGSRHAGVMPALFDALERITATGRQTWRDARMALLERIAELGSAADAASLGSYLADADVRVGDEAANIIARWTGERPDSVLPMRPQSLELPSIAALDSLADADVRIETAEGNLVLRLLPGVAPTNAYRFARLARAGYYDGLTFHRVVPNFVVQGGSPHANEYAGDDLFTRDELGLVYNWRGTVGLSTRGRDTGDAQIYINLVDNVRLDHNYTIFAEVTEGMDVVDRLLEGALIRRVTVQ